MLGAGTIQFVHDVLQDLQIYLMTLIRKLAIFEWSLSMYIRFSLGMFKSAGNLRTISYKAASLPLHTNFPSVDYRITGQHYASINILNNQPLLPDRLLLFVHGDNCAATEDANYIFRISFEEGRIPSKASNNITPPRLASIRVLLRKIRVPKFVVLVSDFQYQVFLNATDFPCQQWCIQGKWIKRSN